MTSNGGTAPPKGQRDGEVDCTAPMATAGLGGIKAGHDLATRGVGRAWLNGREVGGADPSYRHLDASHECKPAGLRCEGNGGEPAGGGRSKRSGEARDHRAWRTTRECA